MKTFDNLGLQEIKKLFAQKKEYVANNDFIKLIDLKKNYPFLFDLEQEAEYNKLCDNLHIFLHLPHIQHQIREKQKSCFIEVNVDDWNMEEYEKLLMETSVVNISNIKEFSRALVRNSIVIAQHIFSQAHIEDKNLFFSCIGFLLAEILNFIDTEETRLKHLNRVIHILTGSSSFFHNKKSSRISAEIKQKIKEKFNEQCLKLFFKFEKRIDFRNDIIFFCLIETAEYISLLKPLFSGADDKEIIREVIANMIESG